jgi:hypothetical protein
MADMLAGSHWQAKSSAAQEVASALAFWIHATAHAGMPERSWATATEMKAAAAARVNEYFILID